MPSKLTCLAFSVALFTGCASQPAYIPKTDEQIKQEALDRTVASMRERDATQDEVDSLVAHSKQSYEDKLRGSISDHSSAAENLVSLVSNGLFYCDLKRSSLKNPISRDYTMKVQRELIECISTSSRVITDYYYKIWIPSPSTDAAQIAVDETFLKWNSYADSIFSGTPIHLQDQAALGVKDQINRTRETLKKTS